MQRLQIPEMLNNNVTDFVFLFEGDASLYKPITSHIRAHDLTSSSPHIRACPRVLAASARRPSRAWRRARPAKTKTKPFRVALRAARTLKTPQGKRSSGYRRGKERFKSSLSATAGGGGGCHRKQQILVIRNRPLAGGRFWLRGATCTLPE